MAGLLIVAIPPPVFPADTSALIDPPAEIDVTNADPGELYWRALVQLRTPLADAQARGREMLERSAQQGNGEASVLIGTSLLNGSHGYAADPVAAVQRLRQAMEQGSDFAGVFLAECQVRGTGTTVDLTAAEALLRDVLVRETAFARASPPDWYWGKAQPGTPDVAGELENNPVESIRAYARYLLGLIGQQRGDHVAAQGEFLAAANAGRAGRAGVWMAAVEAALNCAFGRGANRNRAQAVALLEHARELQRRRGAQEVHGLAMQGVVESFAVADIEESLAESGRQEMAATQFRVAEDFARDDFEFHDLAEARAWYELAAGNDHADGMVALALMQSSGRGGPLDRDSAFRWLEKAGGGNPPRSLHAAACLGICLSHGWGTPADLPRAAALFARYRDEDYLCHLGSIGRVPADVMSAADARSMLEAAAKAEQDAHAVYLLGLRRWRGHGYLVDVEAGRKDIERAAEMGNGAACARMGELARFTNNDETRARKYYERGVELRDATAALGLARLELETVDKSAGQAGLFAARERAVRLCERAVEFAPERAEAYYQCGRSHFLLAEVQSQTKGVDEAVANASNQRAVALLERAMELGSAWAAHELGYRFCYGLGVARDSRKAYMLYSRAAESGIADAEYEIGCMHEFGRGVPVTSSEAAFHFRRAATQGHQLAIHRLAGLYVDGEGFPHDLGKAATLYAVLIQKGDELALIDLGDVMLLGLDVRQGFELFSQLASVQRNGLTSQAVVRLARCYRLGLGVKADPKKSAAFRQRAVVMDQVLGSWARLELRRGQTTRALRLYDLAAEVTADACCKVARIYYDGEKVPADRVRAMEYWRRAAAENHPEALFMLASMTNNREAGAPTLDEAVKLARRAEKARYEKARELRRDLEKRRKEERR